MPEGLLMRIVEPHDSGIIPEGALTPELPLSGIEAIYSLAKNDSEHGSFCTLYFLKDIESVLKATELYQKDVQDNAPQLNSVSWVILFFIDSISRNGESHIPSTAPAPNSVIVANGSSPKEEFVQDYHDWYNQEHGGKLAAVPGWSGGRRYKLETAFGDVETAAFYGVNVYDEVNGLGGPEWKAGVTGWTLRIRDQAAKPNVRRVWKVVNTK